jgi:DNA mismatch endonuclease (patch repair protein)
MSRLPRRNNPPELALRRELFARGLRYRVHYPLPGYRRRSIDIAFPGRRLAVFLDGCFWHSCPQHGVQPATNAEWWRWKLERTAARDEDTNRRLIEAGWDVLRLWEHEPVEQAVAAVERKLTGRR